MAKTLLLLGLLVGVSGCTTITASQGSAAPNSIPATGGCLQLHDALTRMQSANVSLAEWNSPVQDLSGSLLPLKAALIVDGVDQTESMATNYSQMANGPWAKC